MNGRLCQSKGKQEELISECKRSAISNVTNLARRIILGGCRVVELVHAANYKRVCLESGGWLTEECVDDPVICVCRRRSMTLFLFIYLVFFNHTFIDWYTIVEFNHVFIAIRWQTVPMFAFYGWGIPYSHDLFKQGHTSHVSTDGLSGELLLQYCIRVSCSTFAIWRTSFFDGRDTSHFIL